MTCPRCKSENVAMNESVYTKSQRRSLLWNLLMICITGGIWIIWMLVRKRKEKVIHEKRCVCQACGHSWKA